MYNRKANKLVNRLSLWRGFIVPATFAMACLAVSPQARATCNNIPCAASDNTYFGDSAVTTPTGADNTAIGFDALFSNTSGIQNTAIGSQTLVANTEGYNNTAVGKTALQSNTTAIDGVAVGVAALQLNTTGNFNTGIGLSALTQNTTGTLNTAVGTSALFYSNGNSNTAVGANALGFTVTGSNNTAEGYQALYNTTGSSNIGIGSGAGINMTTGSSNIEIGNSGLGNDNRVIRIGTQRTQTRAFMAGIYPVGLTGSTVVVTSAGQLGIMGSSKRFKQDIHSMANDSDKLLALRPVSFHYKPEIDPERRSQFGLLAEEVEKIDPELVTCDEQGRPFTVRYEAVNAMLLNEFLKEHRKVEQLGSTVAQQRKAIEALTASVKEQSAQIQKVSAQLAADKPAPRVVSLQ